MKTWSGMLIADTFEAEVDITKTEEGKWYGEGTMLMEEGMSIVNSNIFEYQTNIGKIIIKNINFQCGINGYKFSFIVVGNPEF